MKTRLEAAAIETHGLGKRYRRGWALRDCTLELPMGRMAALVGANGAGKSTLMKLAAGLISPSQGVIRVMGGGVSSGIHDKVAFLSQDKPLYRRFTVAEMLRFGHALNPTWDDNYAQRLVHEAGVPATARVGSLSGGHWTRVALALAMGKRPDLLLLDEPFANLDPLARNDVMRALQAEAAELGMTVLLSSHVLADLEEACDHLIVMGGGQVKLDGGIDDLLADHRIMRGPTDQMPPVSERGLTVEARITGRQMTALVRDPDLTRPGWTWETPTLEEIVLGYMRAGSEAQR